MHILVTVDYTHEGSRFAWIPRCTEINTRQSQSRIWLSTCVRACSRPIARRIDRLILEFRLLMRIPRATRYRPLFRARPILSTSINITKQVNACSLHNICPCHTIHVIACIYCIFIGSYIFPYHSFRRCHCKCSSLTEVPHLNCYRPTKFHRFKGI